MLNRTQVATGQSGFFGMATFIFSKQSGYGNSHTPRQLALEFLSIYISNSLQKGQNIVAQMFLRN
jgi:hypothetical protein